MNFNKSLMFMRFKSLVVLAFLSLAGGFSILAQDNKVKTPNIKPSANNNEKQKVNDTTSKDNDKKDNKKDDKKGDNKNSKSNITAEQVAETSISHFMVVARTLIRFAKPAMKKGN